jgi:hypothetical protein
MNFDLSERIAECIEDLGSIKKQQDQWQEQIKIYEQIMTWVAGKLVEVGCWIVACKQVKDGGETGWALTAVVPGLCRATSVPEYVGIRFWHDVDRKGPASVPTELRFEYDTAYADGKCDAPELADKIVELVNQILANHMHPDWAVDDREECVQRVVRSLMFVNTKGLTSMDAERKVAINNLFRWAPVT